MRRADTSLTAAGYRQVFFPDLHRPVYAHRVVYAWFNGEVPAGELVRHLDDVKLNNAPGNLALGSESENHYDLWRNGRRDHKRWAVRGEGHPNSVVTEEVVRSIRQLRESGASLKDLSERYQVAKSTIDRIARRVTWKHVA